MLVNAAKCRDIPFDIYTVSWANLAINFKNSRNVIPSLPVTGLYHLKFDSIYN